MNASRLAVSITTADGQVTRFGPGETDAGRVAEGLSFSTAMPGGYRSLTLNLRRRIDVDMPDIGLLSPVRVYGPGNQTAFEGRVSALPRQHGDGYGVQVQVEGWAAHLRDDESFREIYVDRDPSRWVTPNIDRQAQLAAAGVPLASWGSSSDGGLTWNIEPVSQPDELNSELWYEAPGGLTVRGIGYRGAQTGTWTNFEAPTLWGFSDWTAGSATSVALTLDDTVRVDTLPAARRYVMLRAWLMTGPYTPAAGHQRRFPRIAAYGSHGLTLRAIAGEPHGVYASDVISNVISRACPKLTASVEATSFAIPHLAFPDCTTAEDVASRANAFHLWEWGVYDDRVFFYRMPSADRLTWEARLSEGAHISLEGDQAGDLANGVIVQYTDPVKGSRTVGPTGASTDDTSASLTDTAATNVANMHGYSRKWPRLDISQTTTLAGATQLGAAWLALNKIPQRKGQITLTGLVRHPTEGRVPAWRVRAGDYIRISDHPADVPRRIVETTYDHDQGRVTCSVGSGADTLSAILERIGVAIVGI